MIKSIIEYDRKLGLEHRQLRQKLTHKDEKVIELADNYLDAYCEFYKITVENVVAAIRKFSARYLEDIVQFQQRGNYPSAGAGHEFRLSRQEYDLFLISSIFFTPHRFEIFKQLHKLAFPFGNCLSIGVGSGIELEFVQPHVTQCTAYDLEISEFTKLKYPDVRFRESLFVGQEKNFSTIFLIELIEHLNHPYQLIAQLFSALAPNGKLILTTAKNIPQFDHVYNFQSDELFEQRVQEIGFQIVQKIIIPHKYLFLKIDAENVFYVLEKPSLVNIKI